MGRKDTPKQRRQVLVRRLAKKGIGGAVISNPKHIFYLTGFATNLVPYFVLGKGARSTSFLALREDGEGSLIVGNSELRNPWVGGNTKPIIEGYQGDVVGYADYDLDLTMVAYGSQLAPEMKRWLRSALADKPKRVGIEEWHIAETYTNSIRKVMPESRLMGISETIMEMRRTKGKDELDCIRQANKVLDYAYGFARETAVAGKSEFDVFGEMNRAAFERFGPFALIGGDVVSSGRALEVGGLASKRKLKRGDTLILDMQTAYSNYWADTARTFVIGSPSEKQKGVHEAIVEAKAMAARMLKPGVTASAVAAAVDDFFTKNGHPKLIHHAGHAVGLDDQERPWLIRGSKDRVDEGQAYVIEPGIYDKTIGGMRVEDCYFVTSSGVEKVSHFPLEL